MNEKLSGDRQLAGLQERAGLDRASVKVPIQIVLRGRTSRRQGHYVKAVGMECTAEASALR